MPRSGLAGAVTCIPFCLQPLDHFVPARTISPGAVHEDDCGLGCVLRVSAHGFLPFLPYSGTHASSTSNKSTLGNLSCHLTRTLMTGRWVNRILRGAGSGAALAPRATLPSLGNA